MMETKIISSLFFIKLLLVIPLVFALCMISDENEDMIGVDGYPNADAVSSNRLAVMNALAKHPPSNRVFRGVSEIILLLYCTAFALHFWEKNLGSDVIGYLLFAANETNGENSNVQIIQVSDDDYKLIEGMEDDNHDDDDDDDGDDDDDDDDDDNQSDIHKHVDNSDQKEEYDDVEDEHIRDFHTSKQSDSSLLSFPPSPESVASAATDLFLVFLICLILFTFNYAANTKHLQLQKYEQQQQQQQNSSSNLNQTNHPASPYNYNAIAITISGLAAPIFPLFLFFFCVIALIFPTYKRFPFLQIVRRTIEAPFYDVTFRDGFIGDIFTSMVRPMQDLTFTTFYLFSGLQGWWSSQYNLDQAAAPVEHSWLVYMVLLPACIASPLWWRFLQNLRQCHDAKKRWPYLGNALKYFLAAQVALFGVFTPSNKKSRIWIMSFVGATLYQIWWDTFMDWGLLVPIRNTSNNPPHDNNHNKNNNSGISSLFPSYQLRSNRLYTNKSLYYVIFGINLLLRFCWTLSFLPPQYISKAGVILDAFGSDFETFISPVLATAEIIRRTLWGLLRVEWEVIKTVGTTTTTTTTKDDLHIVDAIETGHLEMKQMTLEKMPVESSNVNYPQQTHIWMDPSQPLNSSSSSLIPPTFFTIIQSDMSKSSETQILGELCLWATAFTSVGIIAAAHRG